MSSGWGTSWGNSWGNSFGSLPTSGTSVSWGDSWGDSWVDSWGAITSQNADTHDGYFHKLWEKLRKKQERINRAKDLTEQLEDIDEEIKTVRAAILPNKPIYIESIPVPPIEAKARLIEALIIRAAIIRKELEDEEEAETLLLL